MKTRIYYHPETNEIYEVILSKAFCFQNHPVYIMKSDTDAFFCDDSHLERFILLGDL